MRKIIYINEANIAPNLVDMDMTALNNISDRSLNLEDSGISLLSEISIMIKKEGKIEIPSIPIKFTSEFDLKLFQIIKNLFVSIFKIVYPEEFFIDIYNEKLHSIIGLIKDTKEVICFSHIDIDQKVRKATVMTMGVVKEYQNKKIGSRLMKKVLEELILMGITEVSLIVQEKNEIAIKMYRKFGFNVEKILEEYYSIGTKDDNRALLMSRSLVIVPKEWYIELFQRIANFFCV